MTHGTATYHPETQLLILKIDGERTIYAVEDVRPNVEVANPAYKLTKMKVVLPNEAEKFATLEPTETVYHIALQVHGYSCDCPDYEFRRSQSGQCCKHLSAAIATGLVPKIPHNTEKA